MMVLFGLVTVVEAQTYEMGDLARMGPGYFPTLLGSVLVLLGLLIPFAGDSDEEHGDAGRAIDTGARLRGFLCIVAGILAFMVSTRYGGLVPGTFALVFVAAMGDRSHTVKSALVLAAAITLFAAIVFAWALQVQFPLFRWG
ncbi:MAG TPA: tripartite tricarboxylate transporter TctB family protein [Woeseiaceae bacterium]